ncbi:MAG: MlaD family protein [Candidatus Hydrothermales bacterium]
MDKRKLLSGLFVLFSLFVLVFIYVFFTEFKIAKNRYYYEAEVPDASWLERGDLVTVLGVNLGRVEKLWIEKDKVIIRFFVDGVKLREGAKIIVENQGFLGRKRLVIKQGSGKEIPPFTRIKGQTGWDLGNLLAAGEKIIDSLNLLLKEVKALVLTYKVVGEELLTELKNTSKELSEFLLTWKKTGENVNALIEKVSHVYLLVTRVDSLLKKVEESNGTLKKFLTDDSTYKKVDSLLTEVRDLIKDIKKDPRRYFKFSIF